MKRAFLLVLAVLAFAPPSAADERTDEARAAMRSGTDALERRDGEKALASFETAKRLVPEANAPYYFAASALEMLGRWREAVENLEVYLAKDPTVSDAGQVKERIARIRVTYFPARLTVVATGAEDVTIFVDGSPKGPPGALELPPGAHSIEGRAPSHDAVSQRVDLEGDHDATITLTFASRALVLPPPPPPARVQSSGMPWRATGFIIAGVGAATLGTAVILDATIVGDKNDEYNNASRARSADAPSLLSGAQTLQTAVITTYIVGAVILAGGLTLALLAPRRPTTQPQALLTF